MQRLLATSMWLLQLLLLLLPMFNLWVTTVAIAGATFPDDRIDACPDIFQESVISPRQPLPLRALRRLDAHRLAELAAPLAVPRPVGSAGHRRVRDRLLESLRSLGRRWCVELDAFDDVTPRGRRRFENILATLQPEPGSSMPPARPRRRLVLAAHYDSKMLSPAFVGAIDSAVPCAVLLLIAESLQWSDQQLATVQLVFFDGEEAFQRWSESDSLYGSRHLAARWATEEGANPGCPSAREIEALTVVDLLGAKDPKFYYNPSLASSQKRVVAMETRLFEELVAVETAIHSADNDNEATGSVGSGLLSPRARGHRYFQQPDERSPGPVQDDQAPFQAIGVPAVHVIPQPFPQVWHTDADNLDAVEWDQAADVATILFAWLARRILPEN